MTRNVPDCLVEDLLQGLGLGWQICGADSFHPPFRDLGRRHYSVMALGMVSEVSTTHQQLLLITRLGLQNDIYSPSFI